MVASGRHTRRTLGTWSGHGPGARRRRELHRGVGAGGIREPWRLVIDTATRRTRAWPSAGVASWRPWTSATCADRHGSHLLEQLDEVLDQAGIGMADIEAIGVGTGPGSFTGLRVGLATAKTLASRRHLPLVGLADRRGAARAAAASWAPRAADAVVVLPAGAHDHYLACPGPTRARAAGHGPRWPWSGPGRSWPWTWMAGARWLGPLDAAARAGGSPGPLELGRSALEGLPGAALGAARRPARAAVTSRTRPRSCPPTWRCRGASPQRRRRRRRAGRRSEGRGHGRPTSAEAARRADDARRHRRPSTPSSGPASRCRGRPTPSARSSRPTAGALPGRPRRRRDRRLRRHLADGRRGARHHVRGAARVAPARHRRRG